MYNIFPHTQICVWNSDKGFVHGVLKNSWSHAPAHIQLQNLNAISDNFIKKYIHADSILRLIEFIQGLRVRVITHLRNVSNRSG